MRQEMAQLYQQGESVVGVCLARKLKYRQNKALSGSLGGREPFCTATALAYQLLISEKQLPRFLRESSPEDQEAVLKLIPATDLPNLLHRTGNWGLSMPFIRKATDIWLAISPYLPAEPRWAGLFVDEVQDLPDGYVEFLEAVRDKYLKPGGAVHAFGDPRQSIYGFLHRRRNSSGLFDHPESLLGPEFEVLALKKCYRMSRELQEFANGFARYAFGDQAPYDTADATDGDIPEIIGCQNIPDLHGQVLEIVKSIRGRSRTQKIDIITRTHREAALLRNATSDVEHLEVSTIHAFKGSESDSIIVANAALMDGLDLEEANLWNVAITRARKSLHILTTQPYENVVTRFEEGTFVGTNRQRKVFCRVSEGPGLRKEELSFANASASTVDSLEIRMAIEEVPNLRGDGTYLRSSSKYQRKRARTFVFRGQEFPYVLVRSRGRLTFDFHDLTEFKRCGMDDAEILEACKYAIADYCHFRISEEALSRIELRRMDLARYLRFPTMMAMQRAQSMLEAMFRISKPGKVRNVHGTVYLNQAGTRKNRSKADRGCRLYPCTRKQNGNHVVDAEHVLKLETFHRKLKGTTLGTLESMAKTDGALDTELQRELEHSMPFLKEEAPQNLKLLLRRMEENHGIECGSHVIEAIDSGLGKGKGMATKLFWTLLLLDDAEVSMSALRMLGIEEGRELLNSEAERQEPPEEHDDRQLVAQISEKLGRIRTLLAEQGEGAPSTAREGPWAADPVPEMPPDKESRWIIDLDWSVTEQIV
tara:strand:- start:10713 stop:13001 length:2289 start_codon:yes stop_codon:yes gene_type:complete